VRRLLGTVVGAEPDTLTASGELHRLGAVRPPADAAEPRRPDWEVAAVRRHGVGGGTASGVAEA
jgi:hypothetical protein